MAYSTRAELRAKLNVQLGIVDGQATPWGDRDARNSAIEYGFEQLEPMMMRLTQESVTILEDTYEYDLATVRTVELIERVDISSTPRVIDTMRNYEAWVLDDDDSTCRLRLTAQLPLTEQLVVTGYAPYLAAFPADATECDIEPRLEWIPLIGAVAELYRRRFHVWLDFEHRQLDNPVTAVDPDTLYRAYSDAQTRFERAKADHVRTLTRAKRARTRY